jgi:hypothetical protein
VSLKISDLNDTQLVRGDTIRIMCRNLKDMDGVDYDMSAAGVWYCTVKSDLTTVDASAEIHLTSTANASQFDLTNVATGQLKVTLSPANSAALTAGTNYYLQVKKIFTSGDVLSVVFEPEFRVYERVVITAPV